MKLSKLTFLLGMAFISCQSEVIDFVPKEEGVESGILTNHTRGISESINEMNQYIGANELGHDGTRAGAPKDVKNVQVITRWQGITRSMSSNIPSDMDTLLYIVNFENEGGFAILAADDRTPEVVLGVVDEGNIDVGSDILTTDQKYIFPDFPLEGPGFFTEYENYGDEVFMNPNTVNLYDESEGDYLIGNFRMDDIGAVDANGVPYNDHSEDVDDLEINLILGVCLEYVTSDRPVVPDQGLAPLVPVIPGEIPPGGGSAPTTTTKTVRSSWRISQAVDPLLDFAKKWHQDSPFNNYNHNRRKYGFCGPQRHAPAGCFPLSIAKIFTYFKKPSPMYRGNYLINWDELYKDFSSPIGRESAAHLIRLIVDGCDSWCFYKGTFTFPNKALSYIKRQGYTDAKDVSYDFNRVKLMISKKKPVIIYALPGINITKSHAWNIDGYKIQERTDTIKTYNDRKEVIKTETKTVKAEMVHCDFGWRGRATGYYVSSIFKSKGELTEIDNPSLGVPEINFNNYKRVIIY